MSNNSNSDIDLSELAIRGLKYIIKRKTLLLSASFFGVFLACLSIFLNPEKYKVCYTKDFTLTSANSIAPEEIMDEIIEGLDYKLRHKADDDDQHLADLLNIPIWQLNKINGIKSFNVESTPLTTIINMTIEVRDKNIIDSIIVSIEAYINSNPYIKERMRLEHAAKSQLLSVINKQIKEIDSSNFNNLDIKSTINNTSSIFFTYINQMNKFNYVNLYEKKQILELDLIHTETAIKMAMNDSPTLVSNKSKKVLTVIGFALLGVFIVIISELILNIFLKIKTIIKTNSVK